MYLGDKAALQNLRNHSVCVKTDKGIRNINCEYDVVVEELVYVENIPNQNETLEVIEEGKIVRYRPVVLIVR